MDMSLKDLFGLHFTIDLARTLVKFRYSLGNVRRQEYRATIKHIRREGKREFGALRTYHTYSARDFYSALNALTHRKRMKRVRYVINGGGYGL